jgi:short-subunit dehydrogenase
MKDQDTTALVTGASAGLGQEFCRQLADRCERIIAVARRAERLQALAEELSGRAEVIAVEADLNSVEGVTRTLEALRQKGPVQILVNNAGFSTFGEFPDLSIDSQRDMVGLHADTTITLCRAAIPFMREQGGGQIINVSSLGAFLPSKGLAVYGATKAFLNYFSLALQDELSGTGLEVQALCPGYIRTEFHVDILEHGFDPSKIPEEMWSDAGEVVAASLDAMGSGQVLVVPGETSRDLARFGLQAQLDRLQ